MNEAETRAEHIDPALKSAGWGVVEGSHIRREYPITLDRLEGFGRRGKALTADYILVYRNTKLAVIEAKAWDQLPTQGVAQAKNYAAKLAIRYAYSTNGQSIYGIGVQEGPEAEAPCYPTPEELWNRTSPSPTPGAIASPPCLLKTKAVISSPTPWPPRANRNPLYWIPEISLSTDTLT